MKCTVHWLGLIEYEEAYEIQTCLLEERLAGRIPDALLLLEHKPVITLGKSGKLENILVPPEELAKQGVSLVFIDRGGDATYHGPGQLVGYPIMDLRERERDAHVYLRSLEEVLIRTIRDFGIESGRDPSHAGVWVDNQEIAAIGLSLRKWITMHGFALNVNTDLKQFTLINPCGFTNRQATSISELVGREVPMAQVKERLLAHFAEVFQVELETSKDILVRSPDFIGVKGRLPPWFNQKIADPDKVLPVKGLLDGLSLHTVCESALCPNIGGCFSRGTATFLILGNVCTRGCTFCAVKKGSPTPLDNEEPRHLLEAVEKLDLKYVVITSVTRDDLADGGAAHFAKTIRLIHEKKPDTIVEVLIPDFRGSREAIKAIVAARPEVINHNVETVPRLYPEVRPQADYRRSVELLATSKRLDPRIITKSGLMLGLGESREEVMAVMRDLREVGGDLLTIGQYLPPSHRHHPIVNFVTPEEFAGYETTGKEMGFAGVASAPLVRSSFKAAELYHWVLARAE